MSTQLLSITNRVKGFLDHKEGLLLQKYILKMPNGLPALEIGSYCGKSSLYLAQACKQKDSCLFAIDHHKGSEEHAPGELYYDPELADYPKGPINTFPLFQKNIEDANLSQYVIPVVAESLQVSLFWNISLGFVFIDGGHSLKAAQNDYEGFSKHIVPNGFLAIHDVFENPEEGGQAPYFIYQKALSEGFIEVDQQASLRILKKSELNT